MLRASGGSASAVVALVTSTVSERGVGGVTGTPLTVVDSVSITTPARCTASVTVEPLTLPTGSVTWLAPGARRSVWRLSAPPPLATSSTVVSAGVSLNTSTSASG